MIEALIDTNVVLDYAEKREGFFEAAHEIFSHMLRGSFDGFVSASAVTDIYYHLRKRYKDSDSAFPSFGSTRHYAFFRFLRARATPSPASPSPSIASVAGSGTTEGLPLS